MFKSNLFKKYKFGNIILYYPGDISLPADFLGPQDDKKYHQIPLVLRIKDRKHSWSFRFVLLIVLSLFFFSPLFYVVKYLIYNGFDDLSFTSENFSLYLPLGFVLVFLPISLVNIISYIRDELSENWLILTANEMVFSSKSPFKRDWQSTSSQAEIYKKNNINSISIITEISGEAIFDLLRWNTSSYGLETWIFQIKSKEPNVEISEKRRQALEEEFSPFRIEEYLYIKAVDIGSVSYDSLKFIVKILFRVLPEGTSITVDQPAN